MDGLSPITSPTAHTTPRVRQHAHDGSAPHDFRMDVRLLVPAQARVPLLPTHLTSLGAFCRLDGAGRVVYAVCSGDAALGAAPGLGLSGLINSNRCLERRIIHTTPGASPLACVSALWCPVRLPRFAAACGWG